MDRTNGSQFKLSSSSLNLFLECPRCFWLKVVKKVDRPAGIFPSLPSGMDRVLKQHFDRFMEKGELPPELKQLVCMKDCSLFNKKEILEIWRNNFKGIQYLDAETSVLLCGAIDNILVKGEKLIVLDYKTRGFPLKEDTHMHYQTQLDLYNFLLQKNGYLTMDFGFLLFYYPEKVLETGEVIFNTKLVEMEVNPKNGENIFKEGIKVLSAEMPESSKKCTYCSWQVALSK